MSFDGDAHETRRTTLLAVGLAVVAVTLVGAMIWVMGSLSRSAVTGAATVAKATTSGSTPSTATTPSTSSTSTAPPTVGTWTNTVTLPPAEQPTLTAPVPGQTADGVPGAVQTPVAGQTTTPPAQPRTTAAPAQPPAPAPTTAQPAQPAPVAPAVGGINLGCSKANGNGSGKTITATLSFSTTTRVDVVLAPGGIPQRSQAGPGPVSLTATGKGADLCYAQVGGKIVGPVPAS